MQLQEKQIARRDRMLAAARACFMEKGLKGPSLDDIIAQTGGSRRNIYDLFGDKEGLFEAVLLQLIGEILEKADVLPDAEMEPRQWLEEFGRRFLRGMLSPVVIGAFRQLIAISADRRDLGRQAYRRGPAVLHGKLAAYLETQVARGTLEVADPLAAARMLTEMIKGDFQLRLLMTGQREFSDEEIAAHVQKAVRLFLDGTRPRPG